MEAVVQKFDIFNLCRYQLQIITPPSQSAVVPKVLMMWTIDSSLMDQNQKHIKCGIIHSQYFVMEAVLLDFDILNLSRYQLQIIIPPTHSTVVHILILFRTEDSTLMDQNQQIYIKCGIIHSQYLVMEAVLVNLDRLNLSKYQLQIIIPPSQSAVVPKVIMMWTIDSSLMDRNRETYKIWDHS
jgi:hypothetical protein